MRVLFALLISIALLLSATTSSSAQSTFYEAYTKGLELQRTEQWSAAREAFLRAAELHPQPERRIKTYGLNFLHLYDPYIHLAHCEARLGMYAEAARDLEISRRAGVTPQPLLEEIQRKVKQKMAEKAGEPPPPATSPAEPVALLKMESSPSGASVLIDGVERGATPLALTLEEGSHQVQYQLEGYITVSENVAMKKGETQTSRVVLAQVEPGAPPVPVPQAVPEHPVKTEAAEPAASTGVKKPADQAPAVQPQTPEPAQPQPQATTPSASRPVETKVEPAANKEEKDKGLRISKRQQAMIALLAVVIVLLVLMARRTKQAPVQEQTGTSAATQLSATKQRLPRPEDTPTQALYDLGTVKQTPEGATPAPMPSFTELKKQAQPLKEGMSSEFGPYVLEGLLGRGGMGTTYLARRKRDGLPVAVKVPHDHLLDNEEFAQRFLREGSLGSTLHHPNIIRIYEAEKLGNQPYIVMELIEGETLEKKLKRERALPLHTALEIARDIALALDYARLKGVVHRDLKPDNIMILQRGGLKVMDYGIARIIGSPGLTSSEAYLGTPTYSSPESTTGKVDQQSDLYSLGIILYRMLTGEAPFRSTNPLEVLEMHRKAPLPPFPAMLEIPEQVYGLVSTLTAKSKSDRYPDAESFLVDLNRVLKHL